MLTLGIDDAGRGPVIGPMALSCVILDSKHESELRKLGVKDSKQLTQKRREFLSEKIKEVAEAFEVVVSYPEEIDESTGGKDMNLNKLEAIKCADLINKLNDKKTKLKIVIDCPSVSLVSWCEYLKTKIKHLSNLEISCEHKADKNHVSVAAASILAKCKREEEMDEIRKKYGDEVGSGYPSDPATIKFLQQNALKYKDDGIFRKSWKTYQNAVPNPNQKKLF